MKAKIYKGIEFSEDFSMDFKTFKERFGNTHIFNKLVGKDKDNALKEAFAIAQGDDKKSKK